jgi:hypothetical protein
VTHLIWAGVVVYLCERLLRWWDAREARLLTAQVKAVAAAQPADVPQDLVALALNERELWAQEEMLRAMRERYETLKDWNMVRSAFGVAPTGDSL